MGKLKKAMCLLVLVFSLILSSLVFSSKAQESPELPVYYSISSNATLTEEEVDVLFSSVQTQLNAEGIQLVREQVDWLIRPAYRGLRVSFDTNIIMYSDSNAIQGLSPLLYSEYEISTKATDATYHSEIENIMVALSYYHLGYFDLATIAFENSMNSSTNPESINFYLGNIQLYEENYESAYGYFQNLPLHPDGFDIALRSNTAWALWQIGNHESAFNILTEGIERSENRASTYSMAFLLAGRARLHALDLDYDSAIKDIDLAINLMENSYIYDVGILSILYTIRGEIVFLIYEWDRVEENFTTAIELDPTYAPAYFQRGVLFYTMARREDALADFEMYLELEPDDLYAEDAEANIESIQIEIEALDG